MKVTGKAQSQHEDQINEADNTTPEKTQERVLTKRQQSAVNRKTKRRTIRKVALRFIIAPWLKTTAQIHKGAYVRTATGRL